MSKIICGKASLGYIIFPHELDTSKGENAFSNLYTLFFHSWNFAQRVRLAYLNHWKKLAPKYKYPSTKEALITNLHCVTNCTKAKDIVKTGTLTLPSKESLGQGIGIGTYLNNWANAVLIIRELGKIYWKRGERCFCICFFFFWIITLARCTCSILNRNGKNGQPCRVSDLSGKAFSLLLLIMIFTVLLSYMLLIMLK